MRETTVADPLLGEVMVARQPIIDAAFEVVAYELLFRDDLGLPPDDDDAGDRATATVLIDGLLALGREVTTDGDDAFVNVPVSLLRSGTLLGLPPEGLVLEVLHDAAPTEAVRHVLREHREAGFRLALDAVLPGDLRLPLIDEVDLVKVDALLTPQEDALDLVRELSRRDVPVVAGRVEDAATFERFGGAGARLFQGFFFTRPRVVRGMRPIGLPAAHLDLLREVARAEVDLRRVEALIRSDLTLTDRFLRMVDALSGWRSVESVHHGLVLMGTRRLHRWVALLMLSAVESDVPSELLTTASTRARYCEELQRERGAAAGLEPFCLGMFSVLGPDGVLPEPVLQQVPVTDAVRAALQGRPGELRDLLEIALAAEQADWPRLAALGRGLGLEARVLARSHHEALRWSVKVRSATVWGATPSPHGCR